MMTKGLQCLAQVPVGLNTMLHLVGSRSQPPYFVRVRETFMMTGPPEIVAAALPELGAAVLEETSRGEDSIESIVYANSEIPAGWQLHVRRPSLVNRSHVSEDPERAICSTFLRFRQQSRFALDASSQVLLGRAPLGVDYSIRGEQTRTWVAPRITATTLGFTEGYLLFSHLPRVNKGGETVIDAGGGAHIPEYLHTIMCGILLRRGASCQTPGIVVVVEYEDPTTGKLMHAIPR